MPPPGRGRRRRSLAVRPAAMRSRRPSRVRRRNRSALVKPSLPDSPLKRKRSRSVDGPAVGLCGPSFPSPQSSDSPTVSAPAISSVASAASIPLALWTLTWVEVRGKPVAARRGRRRWVRCVPGPPRSSGCRAGSSAAAKLDGQVGDHGRLRQVRRSSAVPSVSRTDEVPRCVRYPAQRARPSPALAAGNRRGRRRRRSRQ
jgi:hypothetical protein